MTQLCSLVSFPYDASKLPLVQRDVSTSEIRFKLLARSDGGKLWVGHDVLEKEACCRIPLWAEPEIFAEGERRTDYRLSRLQPQVEESPQRRVTLDPRHSWSQASEGGLPNPSAADSL